VQENRQLKCPHMNLTEEYALKILYLHDRPQYW